MLTRIHTLRALVDEIADVDWRHPAWWALLAGTAALESPARAHGDVEPEYLSSAGEPWSDTFMGRHRQRAASGAERIAHAVVRARAAVETLAQLDGWFPHQPLRVCLVRRHGALDRMMLDDTGAHRVAFVTAAGTVLATLSTDDRDDATLVRALSEPARSSPLLTPIDPTDDRPTAAAIAVAIADEDPAHAHHLHRRAWTRGGGPWLGLTDAPPMETVSTSHMVVDGYGHALIASGVFEREDRRLARDRALLAVTHAAAPPERMAPLPGVEALGIAATVIGTRDPGFKPMAYAMGRYLDRAYGRRGRFSPTFQVPVAPGPRADPYRRRRRVIPALLSLRADGERLESYEAFRARLPEVMARATAARGLLGRMHDAACNVPLPAVHKRRLVAGGAQPSRWFRDLEVLAGRGCLSLLRFAPDEVPAHPLVAVSAPALRATPADRRGGTVTTVVCDRAGFTVTTSGTGDAGDAAGARRHLEMWLEELDRVAATAARSSFTTEGRTMRWNVGT